MSDFDEGFDFDSPPEFDLDSNEEDLDALFDDTDDDFGDEPIKEEKPEPKEEPKPVGGSLKAKSQTQRKKKPTPQGSGQPKKKPVNKQQKPKAKEATPEDIEKLKKKSKEPNKRKMTTVVPDPNAPVQKPVKGTKGKNGKVVRNPNEFSEEQKRAIRQQQQELRGQLEENQGIQQVVNQQQPVKKKKNPLKLVVGLVVIALVGGIGYYMVSQNKTPIQIPMEEKYEGSGKESLDNLQSALNNYKAEDIDKIVGKDNADSYLAQEWAYANTNEIREKWVKLVAKSVSFSYPEVQQLDTDGNPIKGKKTESMMNDGKGLIVTHLDYGKLAENISVEKPDIEKEFKIKNYKETDYDFQDECIDLMLTYLEGISDFPTKQDSIDIEISDGKIADDSSLDNLLYASDEFHDLCDEFDKIFTNFTGKKTEYYWGTEKVHNEKYDEWYKLFKKYYDADNGHFHKGTSKWEPWYKRDKNNKILKDKNGKKIVRYYSVKDKNGKDWIQPSKTKVVKVQKTREVDVTYVPETAVTHCFIGANYCQNEYDGEQNPSIRVGDGTIEHPAGIGTPIITSVKCTDGKYHDVKVAMTGVWIGKDAIDYCVTFSEKNRGIDPESVVQIIAYEIEVENLENKAITINSEMCLCDENSNKSARTGTMYGFTTDNVTIAAHEKEIINDWASSTEIDQKYAIWGKTFDREYNTVYFKILAGTGEIPTYSAYRAFTSKAGESGSSQVKPREDETTIGGKYTDEQLEQNPNEGFERNDGMEDTGGTDSLSGGTDSLDDSSSGDTTYSDSSSDTSSEDTSSESDGLGTDTGDSSSYEEETTDEEASGGFGD